MNNIQVVGKFLDQPMLVSKFKKTIPAILATGAAAYTIHDAIHQEKGERGKRALKTGITLGTTVAAALAAPHIASKLTKRALPESINKIKQTNTELVDSFVKSNLLEESTVELLEKSKKNALNIKEVKKLFSNLSKKTNGKEFLNKLIPEPQNISAKDIFSEIGFLSINGAIPVIGGITGGIVADRLTDRENWKDKITDKVKEGSYQYLANIFMCNVGAGIALGILEKAGITSKSARAFGMTAGIIATGIIGGSKIANCISEKLIEPLCHKKDKTHTHKEPINDEKLKKHIAHHHRPHEHKVRTPELLDIGLHVDDIATVSLLSGLKWIEPALPIMYTISGYRAGIGYRN